VPNILIRKPIALLKAEAEETEVQALITHGGENTAVLLMLGLPGDTWLRLGVWLLFGLVIYFFYGMRHSRVANETAKACE